MAETKIARGGRQLPDWRAGAVAGIVGGLCYTVFVEVANLAANGMGAFFHPFRQIGAVVLGARALEAGYDVWTAAGVGTAVHLAIAAAFGVVVASVLARFDAASTSASVVLGLGAGLGLYALDVLVVFPAAFPWFLGNDRITQSIGHALIGAVTGAWLVRPHSTGTRSRASER